MTKIRNTSRALPRAARRRVRCGGSGCAGGGALGARGGRGRRGAGGPAARRSASSSAARCRVIVIDAVALAERGVGLAVGDVRAKPAFLDHDRASWPSGSSPSSRSGGAAAARPPAPGLRLREHLLGLGQREGEQLVLAVQRPAVGALLDVRAVPAVLHGDRSRRPARRWCAAASAASARRPASRCPATSTRAARTYRGLAVSARRRQHLGRRTGRTGPLLATIWCPWPGRCRARRRRWAGRTAPRPARRSARRARSPRARSPAGRPAPGTARTGRPAPRCRCPPAGTSSRPGRRCRPGR